MNRALRYGTSEFRARPGATLTRSTREFTIRSQVFRGCGRLVQAFPSPSTSFSSSTMTCRREEDDAALV